MKFDEQLFLAYSKSWDAARRLTEEIVAPRLKTQGHKLAYAWLAQSAELTGVDLIKEGWIVDEYNNGIQVYRNGADRTFNMCIRLHKIAYTCENMGFGHRAPCSECEPHYDFKEVIVPASFLNEHGVAL